MRIRKIVLLGFLITSLMFANPQLGRSEIRSKMQNDTSIVHPNGLRWGLEEGYTIGYTYYSEFSDPAPEVFHFYMTIDFFPVIQDNISETSQVVLNESFYTMRFDNGTELEPSILYPLAAIPVGNWTFLQQIVDPSFFGYGHPLSETEWIDTGDEWGFKLTYSWSIYYRTEVIFRFSKSDGALNIFHGEALDEDLQVRYTEITRDIFRFPDDILLILIGGLVATVIVLSIVIARRRR